MELGLALHLPTYNSQKSTSDSEKNAYDCLDGKKNFNKKRLFEEAFVQETVNIVDLSTNLLLWSGQPNDEDDDRKRIKKETYLPLVTMDDDVQSKIVGWPPLNSWRKKFLHNDHRQLIDGRRHGQNHHHVVARQGRKCCQ